MFSFVSKKKLRYYHICQYYYNETLGGLGKNTVGSTGENAREAWIGALAALFEILLKSALSTIQAISQSINSLLHNSDF